MDWFNKGLCNKGYHKSLEKWNINVPCVNCSSVNNLINSIGNCEDMYLYRSLHFYEKEILSGNLHSFNYRIYDSDMCSDYLGNVKKGYFEKIPLSYGEDYFHSVVDRLFYSIRETENNNKKSIKKVYSYSKSFIVPLLAYVDRNISENIIVVKRMPVNAFNIEYSCNYFNYVKDIDGNNYDSYLSELIIPIRGILSSDMVSLFEVYTKDDPYSWKKGLCFLKDYLYSNEDFDIELAELDNIENICISSFTLDLSTIDRGILEEYFMKCSSSGKSIKKVANFKNDREIISSIPGCYLSSNSDFFIKGNKTIGVLQAIVISILFLKMYSVNKRNEDCILGHIKRLKNSLPIFEFGRLNTLISNIERNYEEESKTFWSIVYNIVVDSYSIYIYKHMLERYCISNDVVKSIISTLDMQDRENKVKFEFWLRG